jgi:Tetratricopeptide repeat
MHESLSVGIPHRILGEETMMLQSRTALALFAVLSIISAAGAFGQANPGSPASQRESTQDLVTRLSAQQKQQFEDAGKSLSGQHYADALVIYKRLLTELPGDAVLSKFAGEAALNSGDASFALNIVKPLAQADPDDWQAAALLTRACAESGDTSCRDSGIAHMLDLHRRGITPPGMKQYTVERLKAGVNILLIRMSLEPWGYYKVYALGQVLDGEGKIFLRATLESNDVEQAEFAQKHPEEASKGIRKFSLDSYLETGLNSQGQRTQTHYTYKFFIGQPSYEIVREEFVKIAAGKATPLSSRTNLVVP